MPDLRFATCNLCDSLCGLRFSVEDGRIEAIAGDAEDVLSAGHVCAKGVGLRELLSDPDRLRTPVRRTAAGWQAIGWEEAFAEITRKLKAIQRKHGRDAVGLYVGNPVAHSHRAALGSQLLTAALGTKNRFDPNSQDGAPRLFACWQVYGDALALPVPDVDRTEFRLLLGANPAASNGSMVALGDARKRLKAIVKRGGRIVLIDPRRTETAAWCTQHAAIRPGGDAALLLGMLHVLFAEGRVAKDAIASFADGLVELEALAARFAPERVGPAIDIPADTIRQVARDFGAAGSACAYGRIGIAQGEFGPLASWLVEVLNIVTGNLGRAGGAMFPSPATDIGPIARRLGGKVFGRWRSRVRNLPEFLGSLPSAVLAEEIETPGPGQIRALITMAGDPVLSTPNGDRLGRALQGLAFQVGIDFYLNETTRHADIVLPAAHALETGNFDLLLLGLAVRNVARWSPAVVPPPPGVLDDWQIASELALRLRAPWLLRLGRRLLRRLPELLIDGLLRFGKYRLRLADLRAAPHGIDLGPLRPSRRQVQLMPAALVADLPRLERWLAKERETGLLLIGRRHLRSNNSWMHNLDLLVKGPPRTQLLMHPVDAVRLGLEDGARVRVRSGVGEVTAVLALSDTMAPGVVSLPHGFGHSSAAETLRIASKLDGPNVNALTDRLRIEPVVGASILGGVAVEVERA